ncbi:MAG: polyisoprenoid-binding protein [Xanthomonadales bacterium]|nr:polyisoprenoid-binding protein [Xanthomonadales bacterium]
MRRMLALFLMSFGFAGSLSAAEWEIDSAHSNVLFFVAHYDLARSVGRFGQIEGEFEIDPDDPTRNRAVVQIATDSLDMGDARFTQTMLESDWFDAEAHPRIEFRSTQVTPHGDGHWLLQGDLQVAGQTRPVTLELQRYRCATPPFTGRFSCGYSLVGTLDRRDFGLDRFKRWVGHEVELRIEIELQRERSNAGSKHRR